MKISIHDLMSIAACMGDRILTVVGFAVSGSGAEDKKIQHF